MIDEIIGFDKMNLVDDLFEMTIPLILIAEYEVIQVILFLHFFLDLEIELVINLQMIQELYLRIISGKIIRVNRNNNK